MRILNRMTLDSNSVTSTSTSVPLNVSQMRFIAGNTDPGTDGSAAAGTFFNSFSSGIVADPGSLVVARNGTIYFKDDSRGILIVNPSDGIQKVLLKKTGTSSGDGGNVASATVRQPVRIALDYLDRLLIVDYDRIRRVDTTTNPMTIDTFIGGGASSADTVTPLQLSIPPSAVATNYRSMMFTPLPNGDLYFSAETTGSYLNSLPRYRIYSASTNMISTVYLTGTGANNNASLAYNQSDCSQTSYSVGFDPSTSVVNKIIVGLASNCGTGSWTTMRGNFDPSTGVATAPHPPNSTGNNDRAYASQARDGIIYAFNREARRVERYNNGTNTWTTVLGNGVGSTCADGVAATSCGLDPLADVFVNEQGVIYFVMRGVIRAVTSTGTIVTLFGQSLSYGDGGNPVSARFGVLTDLKLWNNGAQDKLVVLDSDEFKLREITLGGSIAAIGGNGASTTAGAASATAQGLQTYGGYSNALNPLFALDPSNGNIFYGQPFIFLKLTRGTGNWSIVAGNGATGYTSADGLLGNQINFSDGGTMPVALGFDGSSFLGQKSASSAGSLINTAYKKYDISNGTQSAIAGPAASTSFCADGTALGSCGIPYTPTQHTSATYDSYDARWLILQRGTSAVRIMKPGNTMATLVTLPRSANNFAYQRNAASPTIHNVYYCATDGRLYKYNILTSTETAYTWPTSSMSCGGYNLVHSTSRNSLLFIYKQSGLYGVAEYLSP